VIIRVNSWQSFSSFWTDVKNISAIQNVLDGFGKLK